jgi:hypothetical protein
MFDFYYEIQIQYVNGGIYRFKLDKVNLETDDMDSLIEWGSGMLSAGWNPLMKTAYILMYCKAGMIQITKQHDDEEEELSITPEPTENLWITAKIEYMISKEKHVYIHTKTSNKVAYNKVRLNDELLHTDIKLNPIILQFPSIII